MSTASTSGAETAVATSSSTRAPSRMASARARARLRLQTTRTLASGVSRLAKPWTVPIAPAPRIARRTGSATSCPMAFPLSPPLEPMLPAGRAVVNSSSAPHALCPVVAPPLECCAVANDRQEEARHGGFEQHPCGHRRRVVFRAEWRVGHPLRGRPCRRRLQGALREARHHASLLRWGGNVAGTLLPPRGGHLACRPRSGACSAGAPRRGVLPRHAGGAAGHIGGLSGAGLGVPYDVRRTRLCPRGHHVQLVRHGLLRRGRGRVPAAPRGAGLQPAARARAGEPVPSTARLERLADAPHLALGRQRAVAAF